LAVDRYGGRLVGFNIGVEIGQLAAVGSAWFIARSVAFGD
jgi:hypothetical protein